MLDHITHTISQHDNHGNDLKDQSKGTNIHTRHRLEVAPETATSTAKKTVTAQSPPQTSTEGYLLARYRINTRLTYP